MLPFSSERRLVGVDRGLCRIIRRTADYCPTGWSFIVTEGLRTKARQQALYDQGLSRTLDSFHLTGHAVDLAVIVAGKAVWKLEAYAELNRLMQVSAMALGIELKWGGTWTKLRDGPHWQVRR